MTQDEIIRMAREAGLANSFCTCSDCMPHIHKLERFAALVAAHEREKQAEQELVAWMNQINGFICKEKTRGYHVPLYAAPVQQVDLTGNEINRAWESVTNLPITTRETTFARAVIAADREKNK